MTSESGYTNDGINEVKAVPVESKEPTLVPTPAEMGKRVKELHDKVEQNQELFVSTNVLPIEKKKRGRPSKKFLEMVKAEDDIEGGLTAISPKLLKELTPVREYYCGTCRERYLDTTVMKIGAGKGRNALFCPSCTKSLGFSDFAADEKIAELHKNPNQK